MTLQEKNKAAQKRFIEEYQTGGSEKVLEELVSEKFVNHSAFPGMPADKSGIKMFHDIFRRAFPGFKVVVHEMLADGDKIITRKAFVGTHKGEFAGIPPTNKSVELNVMDIVRYEDGKLIEHWNAVDRAGLMRQLGVIK